MHLQDQLDDASFETLFRDSFEVLNNIAYTVVKDKDVSKDIVQQVFYKLWNSRGHLTINTSIRSYLHRAVINTALNHLEKHKRMIPSQEEQLINSGGASHTNVLDQLDHDELESALHEAIDELPPRCRLVFTLSRFEGLTNNEIADRMDTTTKTVENQMGKALKHLRGSLKPFLSNNLISITGLINYFLVGVGVNDYLSVINQML
ncbi:MAG: RNA polymerase sigma-70 factor [Reichenbachiella sp.]|uniref:RNA polymerase sigma-70 factor n=1 Tax=Reichenbachiella sp. TaxID=2184521 RepID=UPI0032667377